MGIRRPFVCCITAALGACLAFTVACSGASAHPRDVEDVATSTPIHATVPAATQASARQIQPKARPTSTPQPKPTASATSTRASVGAKRSDFLVALPTPAVATAPSPTLVSSPSISVTHALTGRSAPPVDCTYAAQFVADVTVPDDSVIEPGAAFLKTWRIRNNGTCDWEAHLQLTFVGGDPMGGPASVPIASTLTQGTVDVSVPLSAPLKGGIYTGYWQLRTPDGQAFGDRIYVRVTVPLASASAHESPPSATGRTVPRLVLLNYFAWYDGDGWDDCNISAGDRPLQPYASDDPAAIARHVRKALEAGADGFTQQWFAPGGRTDRNFATLLAQSQGTDLRSTVVFLRHIWHGSPFPNQANVAEAIRYLLERYAGHPNFLKLDGKPVLFFTDVYRVPIATGQTPQQAWSAIRSQVDPGGSSWWIAEGLDPSYLAVFDGLWVYKITHAIAPQAYLKAGQWAQAVRQWEARTGERKLWIGTVSPGWDDTRAGCRADARAPSPAHKQARGEGTFYRATFDAVLASQPDWLWVNSFNEWVEGTYVEPSALYGDLYSELTRQFAAAFKGQ